MKVLTDTHPGLGAVRPRSTRCRSVCRAGRIAVHGERRGPRIPTLAIRTGHIRRLAGLPELHKDPFDRILVAQALAEGLTLATKDAFLARYGAPVIWE